MSDKTFAQRYSISFLWLTVLISLVLVSAFYQVIQANDFWWYVRLGQEILQHRSIPTTDTWSYTQYGQNIVYHSWLSAVIFWGIYDLGGVVPILIVRGFLLVAFYVTIWLSCREAGAVPPLATLLVVLAALGGINNWVMRPQIFAYPLFGLCLLIMWRWQHGKVRGLWLLPFIMLVWVNVHGSFVIGFLLVGAAFVGGGGNRKALFGPFIAMFVASLLNPRGLGAWAYVVSLLADASSQQFSREWRPPSNTSIA
ncbi:MAG: hypothetical protein KDD89_11685, partial [Anaerolineales bacterium]|nr:hypothetical protein [Anaerolineales bacterium]